MGVIAFIEEEIVIRKVLVHLGLWETPNHDPPWREPDTINDFIFGESYCQRPQTDDWPM